MQTFWNAAISTLGVFAACAGLFALVVGLIFCVGMVFGDDWPWWQRLLGGVGLLIGISVAAGVIAVMVEAQP